MSAWISSVISVVVTAVVGGGMGYGIAQRNRREAHEHLERLASLKATYDAQYDSDYRFADGKPGPSKFLERRRAEDQQWYEREVRLQREYLAQPFYKQIGFVPFPDYAQVK